MKGNSILAVSANRVEGIRMCHEKGRNYKGLLQPLWVKTGSYLCQSKTTAEMDVCVQSDRDRMVAIIHAVAPENDGFIGRLSTSNAFGEDTVSERWVCACVCVCVFVCYDRSWSMTNSNQLGCVLRFLGKGSFSYTRTIITQTQGRCHKASEYIEFTNKWMSFFL